MFEGWGLTADGSTSEGLDLTRRGLDQWRHTGSKFQAPYRIARAADALLIAGEAAEAIVVLDEAFAIGQQTGECWYNAEIDRLKAGAMIIASRDGRAAEAENHYLRALAEARTRHARLIEIRTARDLARLWLRQGRRDEARGLLAPVFASFTEGFDTPDLVSAKALLDELR
jgi:predicted ATPase